MDVPPELTEWHGRFFGAAGQAWIAALPELAAAGLRRWNLSPDGPARNIENTTYKTAGMIDKTM